MWQEPVCDRTAGSFYNASDLNRVEENCGYLAELFGAEIETKAWSRTDFPTVGELARILSNIDALRAVWHVFSTTPDTPPNPVNEFQKANDMEKILGDLKRFYDNGIEALCYTGDIYAGDMIGVI